MILGIGFLLLVSLGVSALVTGLTQLMGTLFGGTALLAHALDLLVSFVFVTALFAMIYKVLPDVRIQWRDVWIGAALTSFLFTIGKFLIGLYLGSGGVTSTYGGRWLTDYGFAVGVLFVADFFLRRGVHTSLCKSVWIGSSSGG
jgi:membrane protein